MGVLYGVSYKYNNFALTSQKWFCMILVYFISFIADDHVLKCPEMKVLFISEAAVILMNRSRLASSCCFSWNLWVRFRGGTWNPGWSLKSYSVNIKDINVICSQKFLYLMKDAFMQKTTELCVFTDRVTYIDARAFNEEVNIMALNLQFLQVCFDERRVART